MFQTIDLVGQTFGRLTVVSEEKVGKTYYCHCQCSCGNKKRIRKNHVSRGAIRSCGCMRNEATKARQRTHGQSNIKGFEGKAYRAWKSMNRRCDCKRLRTWKDYGGRGVRVCDRWNPKAGGSYENFLADMGMPPSIKHSLDKDRLGGIGCKLYSPENCCWATQSEQSRHRRANVYVEYKGERLPIMDACRKAGVSWTRVNRLRKAGVTGDALFAQPSRSSRKQAPARLSEDLTGLDDQKSSNPETLEQLRLWDSAA